MRGATSGSCCPWITFPLAQETALADPLLYSSFGRVMQAEDPHLYESFDSYDTIKLIADQVSAHEGCCSA